MGKKRKLTRHADRKQGISLGERIDCVIAIFAPQYALKNAAARSQFSAWEGAGRGRFLGGWNTSAADCNDDIAMDLPTLRNRAIDLAKNEGLIAGAFREKADQVIGKSGVMPQARISHEALGISEDAAEKLNSQAEAAFARQAPYLDITGMQSFAGLQWSAYHGKEMTGEAVLLVRNGDGDPRRPYPIALQEIDPSRLGDSFRWGSTDALGVKTDANGMPISYSFKDANGESKIIPARDEDFNELVLHFFDRSRPGQLRGVPRIAPVIKLAKFLHEIQMNEVIAQRIARAFAVAIESPNAYAMQQAMTAEETDDGVAIEEHNPGIVMYLNPGESVKDISQSRPGATFDQFMQRILRTFAAAIGIPYEALAKDYAQVSFSSARAAIMDARRHYLSEQQKIGVLFQPIYARIVELAWLAGDFEVDDFYKNRAIYTAAEWVPTGWTWVDPVKDVQASLLGIAGGLTSEHVEIANRGFDWRTINRQRANERMEKLSTGTADLAKEIRVDEILSKINVPLDADEIYAIYGRSKPAGAPIEPRQNNGNRNNGRPANAGFGRIIADR